MAGGTVAIKPDTYGQLAFIAARVLCWALTDKGKVRIDTSLGPAGAVVIPEEIIAGKGSLLLKRGGADVVAGYVAGTNIVVAAGNGNLAMSQDVNTCPSSATQPNATSIATGIGGVPLATTLTYANVGAAGTVNIDWGDGQVTNGAAESGTSNHTYLYPGQYTVTITDASVGTDIGRAVVHVP
jgi:hypothetical protein